VTDAELMAKLRSDWGAEIERACHLSLIPPALVAALIANESGGDTHAKRFEAGVLAALWEVLLGRAANFGSLGRGDLLAYVGPQSIAAAPGAPAPRNPGPYAAAITLQRIDGLATSWGLTQVMGFHAVQPLGIASGAYVDAGPWLAVPDNGLRKTVVLLEDFAREWKIDLAALADSASVISLGTITPLSAAVAALFDCWNTGKANGRTADPQYIPRGLARMQLYRDLPPLPPQAVSA
jgi:hypothetical protein